MKIKQTIGIDISKLTFDVVIHSNQVYGLFDNTPKGFKQLLNWVAQNNPISNNNTLFVLEHTGIFSEQISLFFTKRDIVFSLVSGLEIKRSLGISRGKNDKVDATKIALYAYRLRDEIKPYKMPCENIKKLQSLLSLRDRLVKQRAGFKSSFKEQSRIYAKNQYKILLETQKKMIQYLTKQITNLDYEIKALVEKDTKLTAQYNLMTSIKGIGNQTALFMLVYTNGFLKFKNWRKFASYCGIAPFPNQSGTSLNGKTKISHLANKKVKSLLDLCAKSAIQHSPEMKNYYTRRINNGKNKMSTINVIRNKLLSRIFAVVQRKTPYVNTMKYAA